LLLNIVTTFVTGARRRAECRPGTARRRKVHPGDEAGRTGNGVYNRL